MGASAELQHLRDILELCKAGSHLPEEAIQRLIKAAPPVERLLIDLIESRAVNDDTWGPLWAILILGERRSTHGLPAILNSMPRGNDLIHEAVEFALLRYGRAGAAPILRHLDENPGLDGRVHLYSVLARTADDKAIDYLIAQLRRDEECMGGVAWALAESQDARAMEALEAAAVRFGRQEPELVEALDAVMRSEAGTNPMLQDWRDYWSWLDTEPEVTPDEPEEEPAGAEVEEGPTFQPRCFDVDCPACHAQLEYDATDGSARVVRRAKNKP